MSRHNLHQGSLKIVVGWDPSLESFFAQVQGEANDEDQAKALEPFRGMGFGADLFNNIKDLGQILDMFEVAGINIPDELVLTLLDEQSEPVSHTPFQLSMKSTVLKKLEKLAKNGE